MLIVIHYGEGSDDAVLLGENGSKLLWIVKRYGSSKTLRLSSAMARKGGLATKLVWLPLQSLAVTKKKFFFFCANVFWGGGGEKPFKICWKVPVKYF